MAEESAYLRVFLEKQADGIIFVAAGDSIRHMQQLIVEKLPIIAVDREFKNLDVEYVVSDNHGGGMRATEYLLKLGHHRIGCITGPSTVTPSADRVTGYRAPLKKHSISYDAALVRRGEFDADSGFLATQFFLARNVARPTAIFSCNDLQAIGAVGAIHAAGLRVPEDIAVVGFDDIALAAFTSPPLTDRPSAQIAKGSARGAGLD